jgi:hypothetical protein
MKKILLLIVFSSTVFSAGEEGCCSTPSSSITITDENDSKSYPYTVIVNDSTIVHCYSNGSCVVINN